jgi:bacterioferritin (cytochrome b1)
MLSSQRPFLCPFNRVKTASNGTLVAVPRLSHVRSIKLGVQIGMSLFEALKIVLEDEKTMSEEYVSSLHSKLRLTEEDNMALKRILRDIVADEEKHEELLKLILDSIS